jgi:hypothetical protein
LAVAVLIATLGVPVLITSGLRARRRAEVRRLVFEAFYRSPQIKETAWSRLREMGGAAYPALGEMLLARDTSLTKIYYERVRPKLPQFVLRRLGEEYPPSEARSDAAYVVERLGPVAARGMNGELCRALSLAAGSYADFRILSSLLWSAPESGLAVQAISNYLASPNAGWPDPSWPDEDGRVQELVAKMPEWAPLLAKHFRFRTLLPTTGTNALGSIEALRSVAEGRSNQAAKPGVSSSDLDDLVEERVGAMEVLGSIGKGNPLAVSTLLGLAKEERQELRLAALFALTRLGACPSGSLLAELQRAVIGPKSGYWLTPKFNELGEIGPAAREALPSIEQFTSKEWPAGPGQANRLVIGRLRDELVWLRVSAQFAASRVAPDRAWRYAPDLFSATEYPWILEFIIERKPCAPAFVEKLALGLPTAGANSVRTAAVILAHEPGRVEALEVLRRRASEAELAERLDAAFWLWRMAGDAGPFLSNAPAGLVASENTIAPETAARLGKLGSLARPLGQALKAALESPDLEMRHAAGLALGRIAPELMPPIRECK